MANGIFKSLGTLFSQGNGGETDASGRFRTSSSLPIFGSKQINDNCPLFWDDQQTSGGGTSSTHSAARASSVMAVSATTAGTRVRQTFQHFTYQPARSQQIMMTAIFGTAATGITKRVGYFLTANGLFFEQTSAGMHVVVRSSVSGSPVDTRLVQTAWNLDTMDGRGGSRIILDFTKTQTIIIDFNWLGCGSVRFGFLIDGMPHYCHQVQNSNHLTSVYMSTPNLPVRYEISNSGAGAADSLEAISTSVNTEGGTMEPGITFSAFTPAAVTSLSNTSATYAIFGLKLKTDSLSTRVDVKALSVLLSTSSDTAAWSLVANPTVVNTFTYANVTSSSAMLARGTANNTLSGGTIIASGLLSSGTASYVLLNTDYHLGSTIAGVADTLVLAVSPFTSLGALASITWQEHV